MTIQGPYTMEETDGMGCPFCGGEVRYMPPRPMGLPHFYCDACKVDFTIEHMHVDEERHEVRNLFPDEAIGEWEMRAMGAGEADCPFCGTPIEEWPYGHYLFDSLWCPGCRKRMEFQSHGHGKRSMARTMREFARRA